VNWQLGTGQSHRLSGDGGCDPCQLEQNPAGFDYRYPVIRRSLALSHPRFRWLCRHGFVRENPNPDLSGALYEVGQTDPGSLNLAVRDPGRFQSL